jgi:hypothetical protein
MDAHGITTTEWFGTSGPVDSTMTLREAVTPSRGDRSGEAAQAPDTLPQARPETAVPSQTSMGPGRPTTIWEAVVEWFRGKRSERDA